MEDRSFTFGPKEDHQVAGELLVKLTTEGNLAVTNSIPTGPVRRLANVQLPKSFGLDSLDKALEELGCQSICKVHAPASRHLLNMHETGALASKLTSTYRLRFDDKTKLDKAASKLARYGAVAEVTPNYFRYAQVVPNDPQYGTQWGLEKINCPNAWNRSTGSPNTVVAVIDSGVDLDHPELQPLLVAGQDLVDLAGVSPRPGWHFEGDFLTVDNVPQDEVGHGTHVAGTIAAVSNNGVGVAGVTWQCKIMPVKVLARMVNNADPTRITGVGTAVDIAAGIRWAADNGAHIINMSLGGYNDTFVERDAVAYAVSRGCVVVAAMGNDDTSQPSYPAAYPDVIAVGAIDQSEQRASFSNFGPHISISAPGVSIRSTDWDNTYSSKSGTSMASPHVAGVAALIRSCNDSLSATDIADIIRSTAKPLRNDPADPVPNDHYGFGLVDAEAALNRACPSLPPPPPPCIPPPCPPCFPCVPPPPPPCFPCFPPPPPPCFPCFPPPPPPCFPCFPPPPPPPCLPCLPPPPPPCLPCVPCLPCGPFSQSAHSQGYPYGSGYSYPYYYGYYGQGSNPYPNQGGSMSSDQAQSWPPAYQPSNWYGYYPYGQRHSGQKSGS